MTIRELRHLNAEAFIRAVKHHKARTEDTSYPKKLKYDLNTPIELAFYWSSTEEGHGVWNEINNTGKFDKLEAYLLSESIKQKSMTIRDLKELNYEAFKKAKIYYRQRELEKRKKKTLHKDDFNLDTKLSKAFYWSRTAEGHDVWNSIYYDRDFEPFNKFFFENVIKPTATKRFILDQNIFGICCEDTVYNTSMHSALSWQSIKGGIEVFYDNGSFTHRKITIYKSKLGWAQAYKGKIPPSFRHLQIKKRLENELLRSYKVGDVFKDLVNEEEFEISNLKIDFYNYSHGCSSDHYKMYVRVKKSRNMPNKTACIYNRGKWADRIDEAVNVNPIKFKCGADNQIDNRADRIERSCMPSEVFASPSVSRRSMRFDFEVKEIEFDRHRKRVENNDIRVGDIIEVRRAVRAPFSELTTKVGDLMIVTHVSNKDDVCVTLHVDSLDVTLSKGEYTLAAIHEVDLFYRGYKNTRCMTVLEREIRSDDSYYESQTLGTVKVRENRIIKIKTEVMPHLAIFPKLGDRIECNTDVPLDAMQALANSLENGTWDLSKSKKKKLNKKKHSRDRLKLKLSLSLENKGQLIREGSAMVESSNSIIIRSKNNKI